MILMDYYSTQNESRGWHKRDSLSCICSNMNQSTDIILQRDRIAIIYPLQKAKEDLVAKILMAWCEKCKNGGSSEAPTPVTSHMRRVLYAVHTYKHEIFENIQDTINEVEVEARFEWLFIPDEEILLEFESWIKELGNTGAWISLFQCTMTEHCTHKYLIGKAIIQ